MSDNQQSVSVTNASQLSQASPGSPETWITAAEASTLLHLSLRTILGRAASGKLRAKIPDDMPFTYDGKQNYLIRLEALPQKAQLQYLRTHLPAEQYCTLDLATPRSSFGDTWLSQFIDVAQLVRNAEEIRQKYHSSGKVTENLKALADTNGISLATLYRICGKPSSKELSMLYLDPVFLQPHLPKTMCLWSADFAYALFLDQVRVFSQNSIFRELQKLSDTSCEACPYSPSQDISRETDRFICQTSRGSMRIPNNRRTVNRLLSHIPPQMICYFRKGVREWHSTFGHFALREKPLLVNEVWQGDHHVFDLFVRVKVTRIKNDRSYEQEIAVRSVLTAWMDTATGCLVGWVISILPNADTIAEAFCRAVTLTVGEEFHGLPKAILVDCAKDYRSALLENFPESLRVDRDTPMYLNKRFAGLGILAALGVEIHHALPYHPQSKSIERLFGTLEREWICKLNGWCHSSVSDRPIDFERRLRHLLESKEPLTIEEFAARFQSEILPAYHHFREANQETPWADSWVPALSSMSPLERYNALEKPYLITPEWQTLSALKLHHKPGCSIRHHGIRFQNVWYWDDALRSHIGSTADILFHAVEKPLAPSSITVTVNGRFVCEAFPAYKMAFLDEDQAVLQPHIDGQEQHKAELSRAISRINHSASAILPSEASASALSEKSQLRNQCYAPSIKNEAPALSDGLAVQSGSPEDSLAADASSTQTSPSSIQEVLSFLFGE